MVKLSKAILKVMDEVKGIDKTLTVGAGRNSYKGVSDQEVKKVVGSSMQKHGLSIIPTNIETQVQISEWQEEWQGIPKRKQQVHVEAKCTYLLLHESGESIEIVGYGHGVDSQDKAAGKATTYALKYALLYTFLVPTGKIDDADYKHSSEIEVPRKSKIQKVEKITKEKLKKDRFDKALISISEGKFSKDLMKSKFDLNKTQLKQLEELEDEKG